MSGKSFFDILMEIDSNEVENTTGASASIKSIIDEITYSTGNASANQLAGDRLHETISSQSLDLAKEIYDDWKLREQEEGNIRKMQLKWLKKVLIGQMIGAAVLFVVDFFYSSVNTVIIIGLISAVIIEFIGLLVIMITYFYSERSTKSLDIVAKIMGDVGNNNSGYSKEIINNRKALAADE